MGLLTAIKRLFGISPNARKLEPGDRLLNCEDCDEQFVFDVGEQRFFKSKGFTDPKRCPECRKNIKSRMRRKRRGGNSHNRGGRHHSVIDGRSPYADER